MTISGAEIPSIPDVLIEDDEIRQILLAIKQITEIRNGRRGDINQRFITYYELVDYLNGNDQLVVLATTEGHNHDTLYSLLTHNHQGVYAEIVDVNGVYALVVHDHAGLYSALNHQHSQYIQQAALDELEARVEARAYWQSIL